MTPVLIFAVLLGLTKLAVKLPVLGWLLAIYGLIFTLTSTLLGIVLVPIVFLAMTPIMLVGKRAKLRRDIEGGRAKRVSGSFKVKDRGAAGGSLELGTAKRRLKGAVQPTRGRI